jgi:hypothetical protein
LQIDHEDKGERTFAKVANVMPLPAQTKTPPASTPLLFFSLEPGEFDAKALVALPENHPELEVIVNEIALKQPASSSPEQVQANLQERARAIIETDPGLEGYFED